MGAILANRAHAGPLALASGPPELELLAETRQKKETTLNQNKKVFFLKLLEVFDMFFSNFVLWRVKTPRAKEIPNMR
jgi:hypothetical protein